MKNWIITLLIVSNIATVIAGYAIVKDIKASEDAKFDARLNYLELQYVGFCGDASSFGITNGSHYQTLCGDL